VNRWIVILAALAVGLFLLSYDQRTDDTGVEVALLVATSLAFTVAAPRLAFAIALAIGLPIAGYSLWHGNGPGAAALAFSGIGAALGYAMRRAAVTPTS
jgi:hypothetical protein